MVFAAGSSISKSFESPQQGSSVPAAPDCAKSIRTIPMVPTFGESSPTSVKVDINVDSSVGISEIKRIQGYSNQLFLPEAMVYGNDLIKVWNIDDEQLFGGISQSSMIQIQEKHTYNKLSIDPTIPELPKETTRTSSTTVTNPVSMLEDQMDDVSSAMEMDDLFLDLPSSTINLSPRLPPEPFSPPTAISLPSQVFSPPSPLPPPRSLRRGSGNAKTIVLESTVTSLDEEVSEAIGVTKKPSRGHRRNQSHFEFQFS